MDEWVSGLDSSARTSLSMIPLAPRSGLAAKFGIDTGGRGTVRSRRIDAPFSPTLVAGVIDADYRGNVGVVLFNHNDSDFTSKHFYFLFLYYAIVFWLQSKKAIVLHS